MEDTSPLESIAVRYDFGNDSESYGMAGLIFNAGMDYLSLVAVQEVLFEIIDYCIANPPCEGMGFIDKN